MPRQFEKYRIRDDVTTLGESYFNPIWADLDLRLATLESLQVDWEAALRTVSDQGLARVSEAMSDPLADLAASVASLAAQVLATQEAGMLLDAPGSVTDSNLGTRTLSDGLGPGSDTGTLTTLLGGLASMVKSITGAANWRTAPAVTLSAVATAVTNSVNHLAAKTNPHQTSASQVGALSTTGGTLSGALALGNQPLTGVLVLGFSTEIDNGNSGAAKTITLGLGARQKITLTTSCTLTVDATGAAPGDYVLRIINGGTYTVTWAGSVSASRWLDAASAPAVRIGAGLETLVTMSWNGTSMVQRMEHVGAV